MKVDPRERNERILRAANEAIQSSRNSRPNRLQTFLCECSELDCDVDLQLTLEEYMTLRSHKGRFAVARHHEEEDIERVIDAFDRYTVVAKYNPV